MTFILRFLMAGALLAGGLIWLVKHWNGEEVLLATLFFGMVVLLASEDTR